MDLVCQDPHFYPKLLAGTVRFCASEAKGESQKNLYKMFINEQSLFINACGKGSLQGMCVGGVGGRES